MLRGVRKTSPTETEAGAHSKAEHLLEVDPLDAGHLFFEELWMILRALQEFGPKEVTNEVLSEFVPAGRQIMLTPQKFALRMERGCEEADKLAGPPLPSVRRVAATQSAARSAQDKANCQKAAQRAQQPRQILAHTYQSSRAASVSLTSFCPHA